MIYRLCANVLIIGAMVSVLAGRDTAREPNTTSKKKKEKGLHHLSCLLSSPIFPLFFIFYFPKLNAQLRTL